VAVQVRHAWQQNGMAFVAGLGCGVRLDRGDVAITDDDPGIGMPAVGQKRLFRKDRSHVFLSDSLCPVQ
jgi:hypothetical protein